MTDHFELDQELFADVPGCPPPPVNDPGGPPTDSRSNGRRPPNLKPAEGLTNALDDCTRSTTRGTNALDDCLATYQRWMALDDTGQVLFALAVIAGNLLDTDPLWGLIVGAPSGGKTETITPLVSLPYVHLANAVTEAALLSGVPAKEREAGATGGLLRQVGDFGVLLIKDFTSVLTMHRDARAAALSALREIYDGEWARPVGTGGGRVLHWKGKCGVLGAVTTTIDRHHAVMAALGERFVLYRFDEVDTHAQARRRLANRGSEKRMRTELAEATHAVLDAVDPDAPLRELTEDETERLIDLAVFACAARSAVERDGYDRRVQVMPSHEAPARLVGALSTLLAGLEAIGAPTEDTWTVVTKAAWDCVPNLRRRLILAIADRPGATSIQLQTATGIPRTTAGEVLEDLQLLGLVSGLKTGDQANAQWRWDLAGVAKVPPPMLSRDVGQGEDH